MILIADSGSTKTDWILLDKELGLQTPFEGSGLNPYYSDSSVVSNEVKEVFKSIDASKIAHLYFYGAGCSSPSTKSIISDGLGAFFDQAMIEVNHDLEGAARSLCKNTEGIACILGTGSNAAHFDGNKIVKSAVSLGYLLGDEGSGNYMGKKLIHAIYLKTAPQEIIQDFENTFNLSLEELLIEIYQKPYPNRFLASFTKYINQNKYNPFIADIIQSSFDDFIELVVKPLNLDQKLPVHFTGSIAWFFKDELEAVIRKKGLTLGKVSQKPIEDLSDYHMKNT